MDELWQWIIPAVALIITTSLGLLAGLKLTKAQTNNQNAQSNKADIEAADVIKKASIDLLTPYIEEQGKMRKEITRLAKRVRKLEKQLRSLGVEPYNGE